MALRAQPARKVLEARLAREALLVQPARADLPVPLASEAPWAVLALQVSAVLLALVVPRVLVERRGRKDPPERGVQRALLVPWVSQVQLVHVVLVV